MDKGFTQFTASLCDNARAHNIYCLVKEAIFSLHNPNQQPQKSQQDETTTHFQSTPDQLQHHQICPYEKTNSGQSQYLDHTFHLSPNHFDQLEHQDDRAIFQHCLNHPKPNEYADRGKHIRENPQLNTQSSLNKL
nr:MAG TPA: hypothetical protein [Microviridae sp.]